MCVNQETLKRKMVFVYLPDLPDCHRVKAHEAWKAACAVRAPDGRLYTSLADSYSTSAIKTVKTLHPMIDVAAEDAACLACHQASSMFKIDY